MNLARSANAALKIAFLAVTVVGFGSPAFSQEEPPECEYYGTCEPPPEDPPYEPPDLSRIETQPYSDSDGHVGTKEVEYDSAGHIIHVHATGSKDSLVSDVIPGVSVRTIGSVDFSYRVESPGTPNEQTVYEGGMKHETLIERHAWTPFGVVAGTIEGQAKSDSEARKEFHMSFSGAWVLNRDEIDESKTTEYFVLEGPAAGEVASRTVSEKILVFQVVNGARTNLKEGTEVSSYMLWSTHPVTNARFQTRWSRTEDTFDLRSQNPITTLEEAWETTYRQADAGNETRLIRSSRSSYGWLEQHFDASSQPTGSTYTEYTGRSEWDATMNRPLENTYASRYRNLDGKTYSGRSTENYDYDGNLGSYGLAIEHIQNGNIAFWERHSRYGDNGLTSFSVATGNRAGNPVVWNPAPFNVLAWSSANGFVTGNAGDIPALQAVEEELLWTGIDATSIYVAPWPDEISMELPAE